MKKSISINIQGVIFNIEEDGYEQLRSYLESLRGHFKNYQDNDEILNDIESRIAEIFHSKLSKTKEVITLEDVNDVMNTLGTVSDFEEEGIEEDLLGDDSINVGAEASDEGGSSKNDKNQQQKGKGREDSKSQQRPKRLYRDAKRRILGGVASGLANYFGIDPIFVRLIILLLVFGIHLTPIVFFPGATISIDTLVIITYILLWIIVPTSKELESRSKLYRDDDDGQIGGVASGLAKYMGVDPLYVRLVFILSIFLSGTGILIYFLLWMIVPKAKTVSEKVQMQGKPLTVDNIEKKIKDNLNLEQEGRDNENLITKILFFPFRLIGVILKAIGPALKGVISFIAVFFRFAIATVLIAMSLFLAFFLVIILGLGLGITVGNALEGLGAPVDILQGSVPVIVHFSLFLAGIIPTVLIGMLGIGLLFGKNIIRPIFLGSMFGVWILSLGFVIVSVALAATEFQYEGKVKTEQQWDYSYNSLKLDVRDVSEPDLDLTNISILQHSEPVVRVEVIRAAQGPNKDEARENAKMIAYTFELKDSTLMLDDYYSFNPNSVFRVQRANVRIFVPENVEIIQTKKFKRLANYRIVLNSEMYDDDDNDDPNYTSDLKTLKDKQSDQIQIIKPEPFNKIQIEDYFNVEIIQADVDSISIKGSAKLLDRLEYRQMGSSIQFDYRTNVLFNPNSNNEPPLIRIWTKSPEALEIGGASRVRLMNLTAERLELKVSGSAVCEGELEVDRLILLVEAASDVRLKGNTVRMEAEIGDASKFVGYDLTCTTAILEVNNASSAMVNVEDKLVAEVNNASILKYKGSPKMEVETGNASTIEQLP